MKEKIFEEIKDKLSFNGKMARYYRMAGTRTVYLGSDLERDARSLVVRTMGAMGLHFDHEFNDLDEKQQSELIAIAKDSMREFVQLPSDRASDMTGFEIHNMLSSGC